MKPLHDPHQSRTSRSDVPAVGRDGALRRPRRVQRRNRLRVHTSWAIRSARYYAGGDGAARHPYRGITREPLNR